jgi:hypothetical protein
MMVRGRATSGGIINNHRESIKRLKIECVTAKEAINNHRESIKRLKIECVTAKEAIETLSTLKEVNQNLRNEINWLQNDSEGIELHALYDFFSKGIVWPCTYRARVQVLHPEILS